MTTETMSEIQSKSSSNKSGTSQQGEALDSRSIKSIQLADGWHNVTNCEVVPFAVGNSPVYSFFPTLKYRNEDQQEVYTPLKQILGYSQTPSSSAKRGSQQS